MTSFRNHAVSHSITTCPRRSRCSFAKDRGNSKVQLLLFWLESAKLNMIDICNSCIQHLLHVELQLVNVLTKEMASFRFIGGPVDTLQQNSELVQVQLLALLGSLQAADAQLLQLHFCQFLDALAF